MSATGGVGATASTPTGGSLRITHIGGPTALIEIDGWRLLTDPTFDPPGARYTFGWGSSSRKTAGPALEPDGVGRIDAVLLSHDHHDDNLDAAGRRILPSAGRILTTVSGARRLGTGAVGLRPGEVVHLADPARPTLAVTATPCRHGPPLSGPITGEVIGFGVAREGEERAAVWMTGDTVLTDAVRRSARSLRPDVVLLHLGAVRFGVTGPLRYTMDTREALELIALAGPRLAVPIHYEGWGHFSEGRSRLEAALHQGPSSLGSRVRWLEIGEPTELGNLPGRADDGGR